ncbi:hypothetical protein BBFGKLBO_01331 [Synechococcus sp. CBW1107]|nr:hypothetical protein BBFGKLBO_01331 [Synechococcus sp. CBW1107]
MQRVDRYKLTPGWWRSQQPDAAGGAFSGGSRRLSCHCLRSRSPGPVASTSIHPCTRSPETSSRANPGSGSRPTDTARIFHGPCFHSQPWFAHTGARQDPCAGGRTTNTADTYTRFPIEARPCRSEPCTRSHTRPGCRAPDPPGVRPSQTDTAGGQEEGHTTDGQKSEVMDPFHGRGVADGTYRAGAAAQRSFPVHSFAVQHHQVLTDRLNVLPGRPGTRPAAEPLPVQPPCSGVGQTEVGIRNGCPLTAAGGGLRSHRRPSSVAP